MKWRWLCVCAVGVAVATGTVAGRGERRGRLSVEVVSMPSVKPVRGADVILILEEGREVSLGCTDREGRLETTGPSVEMRPRYILAKRRGYYISGLEWVEGLDRYFIMTLPAGVE